MSKLSYDIMRFMVLYNRHHKVSQTVPFFMHPKTVTMLLRIRIRGHSVMSIKKNHECHYVTVLKFTFVDNLEYIISFPYSVFIHK